MGACIMGSLPIANRLYAFFMDYLLSGLTAGAINAHVRAYHGTNAHYGALCIGDGCPLTLIGGPCVIESKPLPCRWPRGLRRSASVSTCPLSLSHRLIRRTMPPS